MLTFGCCSVELWDPDKRRKVVYVDSKIFTERSVELRRSLFLFHRCIHSNIAMARSNDFDVSFVSCDRYLFFRDNSHMNLSLIFIFYKIKNSLNGQKVSVWVPIHSMAFFFGGITLAEDFSLLPTFIFSSLTWMMLTLMVNTKNHPNPWSRCMVCLFRTLVK